MRTFINLLLMLLISVSGVSTLASTVSQTVSNNKMRVIKNCHCVNCNLQGVNLSGFKPGSNKEQENPFVSKGSGLNSACWKACDFTGADFSNANLSNSNFTTCIRGYVTPITKVNFSSTKLVDVNLSKSTLVGANFQSANLFRANISNSKIYLSNFHKANLSYANLTRTISMVDAMHGWGSNFSKANFRYANLSHANLYGNFQGANFSYANLAGATLISSSNAIAGKGISPSDLWKGVNFSYVDLRDAHLKTIDGKLDLSKAIFCKTIMPDGKLNDRDCK